MIHVSAVGHHWILGVTDGAHRFGVLFSVVIPVELVNDVTDISSDVTIKKKLHLQVIATDKFYVYFICISFI